MSRNETFEWASLLILFCLLGWWYFIQIRFLVRRHRSKHWPTVDAALQNGAVGRIPRLGELLVLRPSLDTRTSSKGCDTRDSSLSMVMRVTLAR
jgi:hypothetical protein